MVQVSVLVEVVDLQSKVVVVGIVVFRTYKSISPVPVVDALKLPDAPTLNGPNDFVAPFANEPVKVWVVLGGGGGAPASLPNSIANDAASLANLREWSA